MNLQLPLTRQWFEMTEAGIKPEDYRLPTAYWCNRFLLYEGKIMPKSFWKEVLLDDCFKSEAENLLYFIRKNIISFQKFTTNIMTLGYPSKTDESRILRYEHAGIEIRTGNSAWGAEPNKLYFVIKHGKRIK